MKMQTTQFTTSLSKLKLIFGVLLIGVLLTGCKQELYSNLSEKDANEMLSILYRSGVDGERVVKKDNLYALAVEPKDFSRATELLKQHGYPKEEFSNMGEIFKKEGLISSPLEERVRFIYALSQNVAETLTQIDGVITARVHIVLPENNPFAEEIKPASASVYIKHHPDSNLEESKSDIKMIVEKSIEGLSYDKVTVVMLPASRYDPAPQQQDSGSNVLVWVMGIALLGLIVVLLKNKNGQNNGPQNGQKLAPAPKPMQELVVNECRKLLPGEDDIEGHAGTA